MVCCPRIGYRIVAVPLLLLVCQLRVQQGAEPAPQDKPQNIGRAAEQRVLEFPAERAMGVVFVRPQRPDGYVTIRRDKSDVFLGVSITGDSSDGWRKLSVAQGQVRCPAAWDV